MKNLDGKAPATIFIASPRHYTVKLTIEQRENFKTLATFLETHAVDNRFDMHGYNSHTHDPREAPLYAPLFLRSRSRSCHTCACAAGWAVYAGIAPQHDENNWHRYIHRVFSASDYVYEWCFSQLWENLDNTPRGAAARIRYMLNFGVPRYAIRCDGDDDIFLNIAAVYSRKTSYLLEAIQ